jgi:hypothetical protein
MIRYSVFYRTKWLLAGALLSLESLGCSLTTLVTKTTVNEVVLWKDTIQLRFRMDRYAKEAWKNYSRSIEGLELNHSFKHGFLDGFNSYLDAGGNCVPPAMPPRKYWRYSRLTPEGAQKIKDYLDGYSQGATTAKSSKIRDLLLVPIYIAPDELNPAMSSLKPQVDGPLNPGFNPEELLPSPLPNTEPEPRQPGDGPVGILPVSTISSKKKVD